MQFFLLGKLSILCDVLTAAIIVLCRLADIGYALTILIDELEDNHFPLGYERE